MLPALSIVHLYNHFYLHFLAKKLFNYKPFVSELDISQFLEDPSLLPCECAKSPFTDGHHRHIITGDLNIIKNNHLQKI